MNDPDAKPLVVNMTRDELVAEYAEWQVRYANSHTPTAEYRTGLCLVRMSFIAGVARKRGIDLSSTERTAAS